LKAADAIAFPAEANKIFNTEFKVIVSLLASEDDEGKRATIKQTILDEIRKKMNIFLRPNLSFR
jgi:hypothetical protein